MHSPVLLFGITNCHGLAQEQCVVQWHKKVTCGLSELLQTIWLCQKLLPLASNTTFSVSCHVSFIRNFISNSEV